MTDITAAKVITPIVTRDNGRVEIEFQAEFNGNTIGFFGTQHEAENALNQHVLDLCEQGLLDAPLGLLAGQALAAANPDWSADPWDDGPSQEEQAASAARWTECEGGWEQFTPHPFDESRRVRLFQPRLFSTVPSDPDPDPPLGWPLPGDSNPPGQRAVSWTDGAGDGAWDTGCSLSVAKAAAVVCVVLVTLWRH